MFPEICHPESKSKTELLNIFNLDGGFLIVELNVVMKLKYLSMKQRDVDDLQPYQTFGLSFKTSLKPEKQITAKSSL